MAPIQRQHVNSAPKAKVRDGAMVIANGQLRRHAFLRTHPSPLLSVVVAILQQHAHSVAPIRVIAMVIASGIMGNAFLRAHPKSLVSLVEATQHQLVHSVVILKDRAMAIARGQMRGHACISMYTSAITPVEPRMILPLQLPLP